MRFTALIAAVAMCSAAPAQAAQSNLPDIARRYVRAQQAVMQQGASPADVSALLAFYTDDYTYYHPQFGAKVAGRDDHRRGVESHLGETKDAMIKILGMLVNGEIVTLSTQTRFKLVSGGQTIVRPGIWVLTFRGARIAQRVDVTPLPLKPSS